MEYVDIYLAILLALLGYLVHHRKMYRLVVGYNSLPEAEKKRINMAGFSKLFRNAFYAMALCIAGGHFGFMALGIFQYYPIFMLTSILVIMVVLLISSRRFQRR